jgi:hypothetical protein
VTDARPMTPEQVAENAPLRLDVAARLAFPDGAMTASGLRKERDRGRLVTELIAGKEFTTLADIQRMRELCRSEAKAPASGQRSDARTRAGRAGNPAGSSSTDELNAALVSALRTAESLPKKRSTPSPPTSPRNTPSAESGTVLQWQSRSQT